MKDYKSKDKQLLDPDVRFLLANERTLLAWVRTGLTLQAGGFALAHFSGSSLSGRMSGILAILCGGLIAIIGYNRFKVVTVVGIAFLLAAIQVVSLIKK